MNVNLDCGGKDRRRIIDSLILGVLEPWRILSRQFKPGDWNWNLYRENWTRTARKVQGFQTCESFKRSKPEGTRVHLPDTRLPPTGNSREDYARCFWRILYVENFVFVYRVQWLWCIFFLRSAYFCKTIVASRRVKNVGNGKTVRRERRPRADYRGRAVSIVFIAC